MLDKQAINSFEKNIYERSRRLYSGKPKIDFNDDIYLLLKMKNEYNMELEDSCAFLGAKNFEFWESEGNFEGIFSNLISEEDLLKYKNIHFNEIMPFIPPYFLFGNEHFCILYPNYYFIFYSENTILDQLGENKYGIKPKF